MNQKTSTFLLAILIALFFIPIFTCLGQTPSEQAHQLHHEGDSLRKLNKIPQGLKKLDQAVTIFLAQEDWEGVYKTTQLEALMLVMNRDIAKAQQILAERYPLGEGKVSEESFYKAKMHYMKAYLAFFSRKYDVILEELTAAIQILQQHEDRGIDLASCYVVRSAAYGGINEHQGAIADLENAIILYEKDKVNNLNSIATSNGNLSIQYSALGNYVKALEYGKKALALREGNIGTPYAQVSASYYSLYGIYSDTYNAEKALQYLKQAIRILEKYPLDNPNAPITMYRAALVDIHVRNGNTQEAIQMARQVLNKYKNDLEGDYYHSFLLRSLAYAYDIQGNGEKAFNYYRQAIATAKKVMTEDDPFVIDCYTLLGSALVKNAKYDEGIKELKYATNLYTKIGAKHNFVSESYEHLAAAYLGKNDIANAKKNIFTAIANNVYEEQKVEDLDLENVISKTDMIEELDLYIQILLKEGNNEGEIQEVADKLYEVIRGIRKEFSSSLELDKVQNEKLISGVFSNQMAYLRQYEGGNEGIFSLLEDSKAIFLKSRLNKAAGETRYDMPDELLEAENQIKSNLHYYKSKLHEEKLKKSPNSTEMKKWENNIFTTQTQLDSISQVFEQNYPNYFALNYKADNISLKDVQEKLSEKQAVVEYFIGDEEIHAIFITQQSSKLYTVEIDKTELNQLINNYRSTFDSKRFSKNPLDAFQHYVKESHQLYQKLLAEGLSALPTSVDQLIMIPDKQLGYIPFETLVTEQVTNMDKVHYKDLPYLLHQYRVCYAYSATLFFQNPSQNKRLSKELIAFAPNYAALDDASASNEVVSSNLRDAIVPLIWNKKEVQKISEMISAAVFMDANATETAFKAQASGHAIIHLAMHALVDDTDPMYSKLVFTQNTSDSTDDGFLNVYELYNMKLDANLAVLSACNTGFGKVVDGEGIVNLGRGFAYAGCPNILMTHWQVDDATTAQLMEAFYTHYTDGKSYADALHQVKLDFLENASPERLHPFYWGSFFLTGDQSAIQATSNSDKWKWIGSVMVLVLVLGGIGYFRKGKV